MWLTSQRLTTYVQYAGAATQYTELLMMAVQTFPRIDGYKVITSATTSVSAIQGTRAYNFHSTAITSNFMGVDPTNTYIAYGGNYAPYLWVYKRSGNSLTLLSTSSFSVQPTGTVNACTWSHDGTKLVVCMGSSPFFHIYNRSGDTFTKVSNPTTILPNQATKASWNQDDSILAISHNSTPFVTIYNRVGDVYTKVANPAVLPSGNAVTVAWNNTGSSLAVGCQTAPNFLTTYNFSGTATYTAISTSSYGIWPLASLNDIAWSPDDTQLSLALVASPYFRSFYRVGDTFFATTGTSNPLAQAHAIAWNSSTSVALGNVFSSNVGGGGQNFAIYNLSGTSTFTKIANPSIIPNATVNGVYWTTDTNKLYMISQGYPNLWSYSRSGDTFTPDSIFDNPNSTSTFFAYGPSNQGLNRLAWSNTGSYLAVCGNNNSVSRIYQYNSSTQYFSTSGFNLFFQNVSGNDIQFSPNDQWLSISVTPSPYIYNYSRNGNNWTQNANPSPLPTGQGNGVSWNNTNSTLAICHNTTPFVTIYNVTATFTKLANPANLPTGNGAGISWNNTGSTLAVGHSTSPFITMYNRDGDTFIKIANPTNLPAQAVNGVSWHPNDNILALAHNNSPYITIYARSGTSTFTRIATPSVIPTSNGLNCKWNRSGDKLGIISANEVIVYDFTGTSTFNAISIDQGLYNAYGFFGLSWSEKY